MDSLSNLATPTSTISRSKGRRGSTSTLKSRSSLNLSSTLPPLPEGEEESLPRSDDETHSQDNDDSVREKTESPPPPVANSKRTWSGANRSHTSGSHSDDFNDDEGFIASTRRKKIRSKQ